MAHSCPECGETCYCGGDIDDICMDWEDDVPCSHCTNEPHVCEDCGYYPCQCDDMEDDDKSLDDADFTTI